MVRPFIFPGLTTRVVFGEGTIAQAGDEVRRLGRGRALVLASPRLREETEALRQSLGAQMAGVFLGAAMHTPAEVTEQALSVFRNAGADCVISLGGGSTTGLGKAIAARTGADHVAIPTTYAGSERPTSWGRPPRARRPPAATLRSDPRW